MNKYCDTYITIKKEALIHNASFFKHQSQKKLIAVIKSNAYGHGLLEVGKILEPHADCFAVASLDSALELRQDGITLPILLLNPLNKDYVKVATMNQLMVTVSSLEYLKEIEALGSFHTPILVHIKIDSGMNRMGLKTKEEYREILEYINSSSLFKAVGVYTHFHSADNKEYSEQQVATFKDIYESYPYDYEYVHICSTNAFLQGHDIIESTHVRIGIGLYGLCDEPQLKQALSMYSKIHIVKDVKKHETVGYSATYEAQKDITIGVLPVGYYDGIIRMNKGRRVFIDGEYSQMVGNVCMNSLMVELPSKDCDQEVELIGDHVTVKEIAEHTQTITYEVVTCLPPHIKRIII